MEGIRKPRTTRTMKTIIKKLQRWAARRAAMAELNAYCLARIYAREAKDWHMVDACNAAVQRKATEIAKADIDGKC